MKLNVEHISVSYFCVYISSCHIAPKVMMDAGSPCPSLSSLHSSNTSPLTRQLSLPIESSTPLGNSVVCSLFPADSTLERGTVEPWVTSEFKTQLVVLSNPVPLSCHYTIDNKSQKMPNINLRAGYLKVLNSVLSKSLNYQIRGLQFEDRKMWWRWFKCEPSKCATFARSDVWL